MARLFQNFREDGNRIMHPSCQYRGRRDGGGGTPFCGRVVRGFRREMRRETGSGRQECCLAVNRNATCYQEAQAPRFGVGNSGRGQSRSFSSDWTRMGNAKRPKSRSFCRRVWRAIPSTRAAWCWFPSVNCSTRRGAESGQAFARLAREVGLRLDSSCCRMKASKSISPSTSASASPRGSRERGWDASGQKRGNQDVAAGLQQRLLEHALQLPDVAGD